MKLKFIILITLLFNGLHLAQAQQSITNTHKDSLNYALNKCNSEYDGSVIDIKVITY